MHYVSWNPLFMPNFKYVGTVVTEFHFFNRIPKKKRKKKEKNIAILLNFYNITNFGERLYFDGDLHLHVTESKLKLKVKTGISLNMVE